MVVVLTLYTHEEELTCICFSERYRRTCKLCVDLCIDFWISVAHSVPAHQNVGIVHVNYLTLAETVVMCALNFHRKTKSIPPSNQKAENWTFLARYDVSHSKTSDVGVFNSRSVCDWHRSIAFRGQSFSLIVIVYAFLIYFEFCSTALNLLFRQIYP